MLHSCFTGVESTPRITAADVRHAGVESSSEQLFAACITPEPPSGWRKGKQWLVDDNKMGIIFNPPVTDSLAGKTLTLVELTPSPTVIGVDAVELRFADTDGHVYSYLPGVPWNDLQSRRSLDIPFAVELAPVYKADSLMRDNVYYIKSPLWCDINGRSTDGLRHVPVTVTRVLPGTSRLPLKVEFRVGHEQELHYILLTYGDGPSATRNFDKYFSFKNPRLQYPRITDENWEHIIHSRVALGMTRDECRLALGTPATLRRGATDAAQVEHWTYDDGVYLIFEDGILTRFRK
ncbi:MAG: DUF2845 domain-containing protein [Muribaculaceae bacterium]|nr:DUF2845 domain-containing protein [Muribaculaceae bacterium]